MERLHEELNEADAEMIMQGLMVPNITITFITISTMTVSVRGHAKITESTFTLEALNRLNSLYNHVKFTVSTLDGTKPSAFSNAFSIKKIFESHGRQLKSGRRLDRSINALVFKNGMIQFSGIKVLNEAQEFYKDICEALDIHHSSLESCKIVMINSNFSVLSNLDIEKLKFILADYESSITSRGSANIKYACSDDKVITIIVFPSGKILITGATCGKHIADAYAFITDKINEAADQVCYTAEVIVKRPAKRGRKSKEEIAQMYDDIVL